MISKIVVQGSTEEAVDVEIVWVGGLQETRRILRPKGVDRFIAERRKAHQPVPEILNALEAEGVRTATGRSFSKKILQHKLWVLGLDTKTARLKALRLIDSLLVKRDRGGRSLRSFAPRVPKLTN